jgi:hypothetical protein
MVSIPTYRSIDHEPAPAGRVLFEPAQGGAANPSSVVQTPGLEVVVEGGKKVNSTVIGSAVTPDKESMRFHGLRMRP